MAELLSWHKVGQKIACVDDTPVPNRRFPPLTLHSVYTIRAVHVPPDPYSHHVGFRLHEFEWEGFYPCRLFRPVYPQAIEQLRNLKAPSDQRELEDV